MTLADLHGEIADVLEGLKKHFRTPTMMTIVIRTPELANGNVVVSEENEDLDKVIEAIRKFQAGVPHDVSKTEAGDLHVFGSRGKQ